MANTDSKRIEPSAAFIGWVFLFFGLLSFSYYFILYIFGQDFRFIWIVTWLYPPVICLIVIFCRRLDVQEIHFRKEATIVFLAFFSFATSIAPSLIFISELHNVYPLERPMSYTLRFLSSFFNIYLLVIGLSHLMRIFKHSFQYPKSVEKKPSNDTAPQRTDIGQQQLRLGKGKTEVDRVINSVLLRSIKADRFASFSLGIMLVLVFIGGTASFGLWFYTQADSINSLESERRKIIALRELLTAEQIDMASNSEMKQFEAINKFIDLHYKDSPKLQETLTQLKDKSKTNYADIAIRVTIAILTIFLVQVFFTIYKYNRHLGVMLDSKAEALELAGYNEDSRKELSKEIVSVIKESTPSFGSNPKTPLEEAIKIVESLKK